MTAFTSVASARRSFAAPSFSSFSTPYGVSQTQQMAPSAVVHPQSFSAPVAAESPKPKKIEWSKEIREWVSRCFAADRAVSGVTQEDIQARLRAVINDAAERGTLSTTDWETFPLVQDLILAERNAVQFHTPYQTQPSNISLQEPYSPVTNPPADSKKRKSSEMHRDDEYSTSKEEGDSRSPWKKTDSRNVFEDRISYADNKHAKRIEKRQRKLGDFSTTPDASKSMTDLEKRRQRFNDAGRNDKSFTAQVSSRDRSPTSVALQGPVIGTCRDLEKSYFRLTAPPKPETVRPLGMLVQTLNFLKDKWRKEKNYSYICDQFKSLRQDLTVQHIKNEFTVTVYETHACIALEKGDLGEYNQCQTQLHALYKQGIKGRKSEFLAYRILYFIHTCNRSDMNDVLADLTVADRKEPAVKNALDMRSALASGNYHRAFRLYEEAPNMGGWLADLFIVRERLAALAMICKAYRPSVKLQHVAQELGFLTVGDCVNFLNDHGGSDLINLHKDDGTANRADEIMFYSGKAGPLFEDLKNQAFRRVDIKGQI